MAQMKKKAGWFEVVTGNDERVPRGHNLSTKAYETICDSIVILCFMRSAEHEAGDDDTYWGDLQITAMKADPGLGEFFISDYKISTSALHEQFQPVIDLITELHHKMPETISEILNICGEYLDERMPPDIAEAYRKKGK